MANLILPGHPGFEETLAQLPPNLQHVRDCTHGDFALIARAGSAGLLEAVSWQEAEEYLWGGEYEQRIGELEKCPGYSSG